MVQGIGGNNFGSIKETSAYQAYYKMYQDYQKSHPESTLTFDGWLQWSGYINTFIKGIENYIETGNEKQGDDSVDTINMMRHVSNGSNAIFQSEDEETFYEFDWDEGTYKIIQGKEEIAKTLGMPEGSNIDTITFGYQKVQLTDYTFGNLDNGQDKTTQNLTNGPYSNVSYVSQEFDLHYIFNALLMDPTDPQYQIAKGIFDDLCANMDQWLPIEDKQYLDDIANEYGTDSAEYKAALQEIMLKNLDQANEWIEEHNHVENTNKGSLTNENDIFNDGTDGVTNGDSSGENKTTVPEYDKTNVLTTAGYATAYSRGDKRKVESTNNSQTARREELQQQLDADLATLANALISQLGDQMTDELQTYINKAVAEVAGDESLITTWKKHHGFLGMHVKTGAEYNIKEVADAFFNAFDTLCKNNGKTTEEVEKEQKQQEETKAQQKEAYKALYNMDINDVASDAGITNFQVVNVNSAAEIIAAAEQKVVEPLMIRIKARLSGKNIPDADLQKIFSYASEKALENPMSWASTTNNVVYTVDASKIVQSFEAAIKEAVIAKGYNF